MPVAPPSAPQKKNRAGLVFGCGCLFFVIGCVLIAVYGVTRARSAFKQIEEGVRTSTSTTSTSSGSTSSDGGTETSTEGSSSMATFANSPEGRTGNLKENYVDFKFNYPADWKLTRDDPDQVNFVSVERLDHGRTLENLNVGYFQSTGNAERDEAVYPQLVAQFQQQFEKQFKNLQKVSEEKTSIGQYNGYQGQFQAVAEGDDGPVTIWIRAVLLPNPDTSSRSGVSILMFGTSLAPELHGIEDVGTKGQLPLVLESFRFGS